MPVSRETPAPSQALRDRLWKALAAVMPNCSDSLTDQLALFASQVLENNDILHLVSQRESHKEVIKQIVDSAAITNHLSLLNGCRILDVGSGAGFPGIVLKLIFPGIQLISLDSSPQKIGFQKQVCSSLNVEVNFEQGDFRRTKLPNPVDIVIVKALGAHVDVMRKSRSWLAPMGRLIFMEGRLPDSSIESTAARLKAFSHVTFLRYSLAVYGSKRHLAIAYKK